MGSIFFGIDAARRLCLFDGGDVRLLGLAEVRWICNAGEKLLAFTSTGAFLVSRWSDPSRLTRPEIAEMALDEVDPRQQIELLTAAARPVAFPGFSRCLDRVRLANCMRRKEIGFAEPLFDVGLLADLGFHGLAMKTAELLELDPTPAGLSWARAHFGRHRDSRAILKKLGSLYGFDMNRLAEACTSFGWPTLDVENVARAAFDPRVRCVTLATVNPGDALAEALASRDGDALISTCHLSALAGNSVPRDTLLKRFEKRVDEIPAFLKVD